MTQTYIYTLSFSHTKYHILIHSSVNGYLDCFRVLAVVNRATMNIQVHVSPPPFFRATPIACGISQARGQIGATAASLHYNHSHSNVESELCLRPTPQLTAMLDPHSTEQGQGLIPCPQGC